MRRYEYRIAQVEWDKKTDRGSQIAGVLNRFGREGWRVVSLDLDRVTNSSGKPVHVLLERRAKKGQAVSSSVKEPVKQSTKTKPAKPKSSLSTPKSGGKRT